MVCHFKWIATGNQGNDRLSPFVENQEETDLFWLFLRVAIGKKVNNVDDSELTHFYVAFSSDH